MTDSGISPERVRAFRLRAHHLDRKLPAGGLAEAAGACGLQNSPPGAWETAVFHRVEDRSLPQLQDALCREKTLLQAWSFRGAPFVFPTVQSEAFLTSLLAQEGEQPWIYTLGIWGALDFLQMDFDGLLPLVRNAAACLDSHTVESKEALDRMLADLVEQRLPEEKKALWRAPSMYGRPDRQTVGGAAVSFLLRPCSFSSLVVFGERKGIAPTFTSFRNWTGRLPGEPPAGQKELVRKFLHCYGPATPDSFQSWLGSSRQQARRLWDNVKEEMEPVTFGGKKKMMLAADADALRHAEADPDRLLLLGAHDPYLDLRDREVILEEKALQKAVWKTVGNPGAVLKGGRVIGFWKPKTQKAALELSLTLFEEVPERDRDRLKALAEEYAAFRGLRLKGCTIET